MENLPKDVKQNKIKSEKQPKKEVVGKMPEKEVKQPVFSDLEMVIINEAKVQATRSGAKVESVLQSKLTFLKSRTKGFTENLRESFRAKNPDASPEMVSMVQDSRYNKEIEALESLLSKV